MTTNGLMLVRLDVTHFFLLHRASYCIPAVVYIISDMSSFVVCDVCHPALFVIVAVIMINLVIYPGGCLMKDIHFLCVCVYFKYISWRWFWIIMLASFFLLLIPQH